MKNLKNSSPKKYEVERYNPNQFIASQNLQKNLDDFLCDVFSKI